MDAGGQQHEAAVSNYAHADDLISQTRYSAAGVPTTSFVQADGFGSTRWLTNGAGGLTDSLDYNAFGEQIGRWGSTYVDHQYRGERFDSISGLYDLRARLYDSRSGRFLTQDSFAGISMDPRSLHKYTYSHADPVNNIDPSGHVTLGEIGVSVGLSVALNVLTTAIGDDQSPDAYAAAATWGVVEGLAFLGVAKLAAKSVSGLYHALQGGRMSALYARAFRTVEGIGPRIGGMNNFYYRMIVNTPIGRVVISSSNQGGSVAGALKHVISDVRKQFAKHGTAIPKLGAAGAQELAEAQLIMEIHAIARQIPMGQIIPNGVKPKLIVTTEGAMWEVGIAIDAETSLLKIFHLRLVKEL